MPDLENWPFLKEWNVLDAILTDETLNEMLSKFWVQAQLFSKADDLSYMRNTAPPAKHENPISNMIFQNIFSPGFITYGCDTCKVGRPDSHY